MRKRLFSALNLTVQLLTNQIASFIVLVLLFNSGRIRPFDLINLPLLIPCQMADSGYFVYYDVSALTKHVFNQS